MSNKNQQIPALRFKGFTDTWEQRKLGEITSYKNGGSFENDVVNQGKYELVSLKSVDVEGDLKESGKFINTEVEKLKSGTIVMILSEQAPGLLGKTAVIPRDDYYVLNQRVAALLPQKSTESFFLSKAINRNGKYFSKRGAGTKVQNISKPNVENFQMFVPNFDEQSKIGTFFQQLDETLSRHQCQLDNYKQLKKSMVQKIFDQELRFKDADGNDYPKWKRRTLGKISEIIMGQSPDSANFTSNEQDTVLIQGNADLNGGKITPRIYTTQITKTCEAGDIILTVRAPVGDLAIANTRACIGRGVCAIKGDPYIYHYLEMIRDTEGWRKIIQGSTFESINSADVKDLPIVVPNSEERKKITIFLSALNKKVENHENIITLLKEQKKGLMQEMFI